MEPISLVILVAVIGGASIYLERKWNARKQSDDTDAPASAEEEQSASAFSQTTDQVRAIGSQAADQAQALRARIPFSRPKPSLAPGFRVWAVEATKEEPVLQEWLASLRDDQFVDFTDNVADFCSTVGFELEWLVREELDRIPQLAGNAEQVVINYCRSCQQAAAAQAALEPFRAYREYTEYPGSRRGRVYGEKLLDRLLESGLTTVSISDFLGATPKAKQEQISEAIQSAAEKDPAGFSQVLMAMSEPDDPAPESQETADSAPDSTAS